MDLHGGLGSREVLAGAEVGEEVPAAGRWLPACQQLLSGLPLARTGWAAFA